MSEGKHTPGPWRYTNKVGCVYSPDCLVAVVGDFGDRGLVKFNSDRWNADARLIAAAPELYEALKRAQEELRLIRMKDCATAYHPGLDVQIMLVIAKAEGKAASHE